MGPSQGLLGLLAGAGFVTKIDEHQVIVCPTGNQVVTSVHHRGCQGDGVATNPDGIIFEGRLQGFPKGHGFGGNNMLQRSALGSRKNPGVQKRGKGTQFTLGVT